MEALVRSELFSWFKTTWKNFVHLRHALDIYLAEKQFHVDFLEDLYIFQQHDNWLNRYEEFYAKFFKLVEVSKVCIKKTNVKNNDLHCFQWELGIYLNSENLINLTKHLSAS